MAKCSPNGNQSFPIDINFTPTQEIYDGVKSGFSIEFNWAKKTTSPTFINVQEALLDEGITTARFQGMDYTLVSTQIVNSTHARWLINPDASSANRLDILCIFKARIPSTETPYIFVVIPIISMDSAAAESKYLLGLAGLCQEKMYSLEDALPAAENRTYASYTTCLEPNGENALVLVFINGRYASLRTTNGIIELSGRGPTTPWPSPKIPSSITLTQPTQMNLDTFDKRVRISTLLTRETSGGQFRADDTYAYKCVVMDPDRDIKDGKLVIDTLTGTPVPLNQVLIDRDKVREFEIPVSGLKPGQLEKAVAIFLGILLGILVLMAIFYLVSRFRPGVTQFVAPEWFKQVSGVAISAVLFSFIGFLIGIFIH